MCQKILDPPGAHDQTVGVCARYHMHPPNTINQLRILSSATLIFFTTHKFCTIKRSVVGLQSTSLGLQPNPACGRACTQAHTSFQDDISTQDTLLSNFDFLHFIQILLSLKDQWWSFGPPLWDSGPILNAFDGHDDLGGCDKTFFIL